MNYELMEVTQAYSILSLDLTDEEIAQALGDRIQDGINFWNKEYDLDKNVAESEQWYLSEVGQEELYGYQSEYRNPRVFTAIETLIPVVTARPPQPVITEAKDTDASRTLAQNLSNALLAKYENLYLKQKAELIARHLYVGYRKAVAKYHLDMTIGPLVRTENGIERAGDIVVDVLRPTKVVYDAYSTRDKTPLIAEFMDSTTEDLCYRFDAKKDDILRLTGMSSGTSPNLAAHQTYEEVWFTYRDKKNKEGEAVAWTFKKLVLDSQKNPHWNYDEYTIDENGNPVSLNYFEKPQKPYINFSVLNLGKYIVDDTSYTKQAMYHAKTINKRGQQINDNADMPRGGLVVSRDAMTQDEATNFTGDPREVIMVNGSAREGAARLPYNELPKIVYDDKKDSEDGVDDVYGANEALRGENSSNKTLGQDVMAKNANLSRVRTLNTALEDGFDKLYKGMVQMFKVFYTDERMLRYASPEGQTLHIPFSSRSVEDGVDISIKSGSMLPDDPAAKLEAAVKFAAVLDPLSIAKAMGSQNPKQDAWAMMSYKMAPDRYVEEFLGQQPLNPTDPGAIAEIEQLNQGVDVPPQQSPSQAHLAQHQAVLDAPEFKQLAPEIQQLHLRHTQAESQNAKGAMGQQAPQPQQQAPQQGGLLQKVSSMFRG